MYMGEDIKNSVIILALDNLISSFSIALESKEITPEDKEFMEFSIESARIILQEFNDKLQPNQKPQWDRI